MVSIASRETGGTFDCAADNPTSSAAGLFQTLAIHRPRAERLGLKAVADADAVAATWASVRGADLRDAARGIRCPTLVVHGELDDECPLDHGRWLADHVPGARWLPLPGVGHAALGQAAATLGSSMSAFLNA